MFDLSQIPFPKIPSLPKQFQRTFFHSENISVGAIISGVSPLSMDVAIKIESLYIVCLCRGID